MSGSGIRAGRRWFLSVALWLGGIGAVQAAIAPTLPGTGMQQTFNGDHLKATFFIPGESLPRFGFVPVRIATDNQQARELRWQVAFDFNMVANSGATMLTRSGTTLTVPASRSGERWVFVPTGDAGSVRSGSYGPGSWANCTVTLAGTGISETRLNFSSGNRSNAMVPWAVSAALENTVRSHLVGLKTDPPPPRPKYPGARSFAVGPQPLLRGAPNLFVFDPAQSFGDWRIWSPFARIILRADEFAAMPPANQAALRNWVALGGMLYLAPDQPGAGGAANLQRYGAGAIVSLREPISGSGAHPSEGLFSRDAIFSSSLAIPYDLSLQKGGLADQVPPAKRAGDWLVYFFVGFAVLVAPVNLFAIAPVKRRQWLFISVPVISLLAVGVLVVAIYLQDGLGGEGARRALVVLLPGDNQAAVFQEQVSRTGLLVGTSFALGDDAICAAVPADDTNFQPGRPLEYLRQEGRASGDWFRGRARQAQHLRRLTPTRARVELVGRSADGAPIVQSSVAAALRDFEYVDEAGAVWASDQIAPGTRVTLRPTTAQFSRHIDEFATVLTPHFQAIVTAATTQRTRAGTSLRQFVALADDSELAPLPTLDTIRWKDSSVLITGIVENTAEARKANP